MIDPNSPIPLVTNTIAYPKMDTHMGRLRLGGKHGKALTYFNIKSVLHQTGYKLACL